MNKALPVLLAFLVAVETASGHWSRPTPTPVARLVENLEAYVSEHPDAAQGYFLLGRVHSLAFTLQSPTIGLWGKRVDSTDELPNIPDRSFHHDEASSQALFWKAPAPMASPLPVDTSLIHLEASLRAFERAIELNDNEPTYHLGYAYIVDSATHLASSLGFAPGPGGEQEIDEPLAIRARVAIQMARRRSGQFAEWSIKPRAWLTERREEILPELLAHRMYADKGVRAFVVELLEQHWRETAADQYYLANTLAIDNDSKIRQQPLRGLWSLISYESGKSFSRLMERSESEENPIPPERAAQLVTVLKNLAVLDAKPENHAITPIVLTLTGRRSLSEMLSDDAVVEFDLDGDGDLEHWPWVKPDTGFLVWDPNGTGEITSGQQLFGSATWWMFFDNGYAALDALDDDRDGWIRGKERRGLAVWFDRNANGISDAGEVRSLEVHGIAALAVRATAMEDGCPAAPTGLVLDDGTVLPTYDWITSPVGESSSEPVSIPAGSLYDSSDSGSAGSPASTAVNSSS